MLHVSTFFTRHFHVSQLSSHHSQYRRCCVPQFLPIMDSFTRQLQLKSDDVVFRVRKVSRYGRCHWPHNRSPFPDQICARVKLLSIALFRRFLHDKHTYCRWSDPSSSPTAVPALFRDWPLDFSLLMHLFLLFSLTCYS